MSDSVTPWTAARQASLSFTISQSLLKFTPIESVVLSNHLILCRSIPLLPSILPSIRVLATVNNVTVNLGTQITLSVSFGYLSRRGIAGSTDSSYFLIFWENYTVFLNGCTTLQSQPQCTGVRFYPRSHWSLPSGVLAWRIPGTGEPGGLPSMGSHRVGHDWSDLAAAARQDECIKPFLCFHIPYTSLTLYFPFCWPESHPLFRLSFLTQGNDISSYTLSSWSYHSYWGNICF